MLTLQDCIGFSGVTPEQLEAIADHEHLEMVVAAEWTEYILDRPDGCAIVEHVLADQLAYCRAHGRTARTQRYQDGLEDFLRCHPH